MKNRTAVTRTACLVLALLLAESAATAQDWAKAMFRDTEHDFGVVARGTKVEYRFALENLYVQDVHIAAVHTSCHCTQPSFTKDLLKTREKAEVVATIDTRSFQGRRDATLRVVFDKPFPAEVQLHSYCYIRSDVVCEPGEINFGTINRGSSTERQVRVSYAGRSDWQIVDVESVYPHLGARLQETQRREGLVAYDLWVELKPDAPAGYVKDRIFLVTNDLNSDANRVPIAVEGLVMAPLSVQPAMLSLGPVEPGETVTRNLVLRAQAAFRVGKVTAPDDRFQCEVLASSPGEVQVVRVRFTAGEKPGKVAGKIVLQTDAAGGETLTVSVDGEIVLRQEEKR